MATSSTDNTLSGGLLVILGIIVAVIAGVFFFNYYGRSDSADITIRAELPAPANSNTAGNQ